MTKSEQTPDLDWHEAVEIMDLRVYYERKLREAEEVVSNLRALEEAHLEGIAAKYAALRTRNTNS